MLGFLRELNCKHEFELIKEIKIYQTESSIMPCKRVLVYMCKNCGRVKKINIK